MPDKRLAEINEVIATTGNDPALDSLIQRLHVETACRCGGALALHAVDLDRQQCLVRLREKGGTTEVAAGLAHPDAASRRPRRRARRRADPHGPLLRYRNGRPIGQRRYIYIWDRVEKHLPWVARRESPLIGCGTPR